jgi:hypothetical protein
MFLCNVTPSSRQGIDKELLELTKLDKVIGHDRQDVEELQHRPDVLRIVLYLHVVKLSILQQSFEDTLCDNWLVGIASQSFTSFMDAMS